LRRLDGFRVVLDDPGGEVLWPLPYRLRLRPQFEVLRHDEPMLELLLASQADNDIAVLGGEEARLVYVAHLAFP
jgi:hypothetical protein